MENRYIVVVWGSHCSGKTVFCKTLSNIVSNHKVLIIHGDEDKRFTKLADEKREVILRLLQAEKSHIVFEGMRAPTGILEAIIDYTIDNKSNKLVLIVAIMDHGRMIHTMKQRKAFRNRTWLTKHETYWTYSKLKYESSHRFVNKITQISKKYSEHVKNIELRFVKLSSFDYSDFSAWDREMMYLSSLLT